MKILLFLLFPVVCYSQGLKNPIWLATATKPIDDTLSSGLVHYWVCSEGTGTNVADSVGGNGLNLMGATWASSPTAIDSNAGTNRAVMASSFTGGNYSYSCWLQLDAVTGVVCGKGSYSDGGYMLNIDASTLYHSAAGQYVSVASALSTGTYYHMVVTRSGTSVRFYRDGSQVGATQTLGANTTIEVNTLMNFSGADNGCNGRLHHVRLYNRQLSDSEVASLYAQGL